MGWTSPSDRSTGDTITSAIWNENSGASGNSVLLKTSVNNSGAVEFVDATELTIASGIITVTGNYHKIDTEGSASSDDVDTITAGTNVSAGFILHLRVESAARTVVLKTGTGGSDNLDIGDTDITLDESFKTFSLVYDGTNWRPFTFAESPTFASLSPLTTRADVLVSTSGVTTGTRLAKGTANQVLSMDASANDVTWADAAVAATSFLGAGNGSTTTTADTMYASTAISGLAITDTIMATWSFTNSGGNILDPRIVQGSVSTQYSVVSENNINGNNSGVSYARPCGASTTIVEASGLLSYSVGGSAVGAGLTISDFTGSYNIGLAFGLAGGTTVWQVQFFKIKGS